MLVTEVIKLIPALVTDVGVDQFLESVFQDWLFGLIQLHCFYPSVSKVGNLSLGRPESSLFNSYNTEV